MGWGRVSSRLGGLLQRDTEVMEERGIQKIQEGTASQI
jgi:hypothetical protein